jgi:L-asparaginase
LTRAPSRASAPFRIAWRRFPHYLAAGRTTAPAGGARRRCPPTHPRQGAPLTIPPRTSRGTGRTYGSPSSIHVGPSRRGAAQARAALAALALAASGLIPGAALAQETPSPADTPAGAELPREPLPRVVIIGTGGTIAGTSESRVGFQSYRAGQLLIEDMVADLRPELDSVAEVTIIQFDNRPSGRYDVGDYHDLSLAIDGALEGADGVVVTTGTDTMEEFVYFMDLTVRSPKPVVFTGAMRPWTVVGSDGPANLFNAVRLAASGATTCFGAVLMLNDEFHAAKDVWKADGARMDTFTSRRVGVLGSVDGANVRVHRHPPRTQHCDDPDRWRTPFDLTRVSKEELPRTEVLIGYQGARLDEAVLAFAQAGVRGIVNAAGGISPEARAEAEEMGVVFASTQRLRSGRDNLLPQKARLLLLLSLAFTDDPEQVARWLTEIGAMEFP